MFTDFRKKNTLGKLVTMATRKRLFLIYKIENFANTQFWKVTKFQGASLFRCGVLSHLLGMGWKTPPSAYRVKLYQVHIRHGGFLGQQRLATHLISVVVWLSWQPKRYLNRYFVFSSYFKSSQQVWRLLRTIGIGHIHHCYGNSVAMATILIPQHYFGIPLICIVLGNKYP